MSSQIPPTSDKIILAAVAENGVIGRDGRLPWHLPEDLAHFRRLTLGQTLIMGRATFLGIGRPLDQRLNLVVSRSLPPQPGIHVCRTFEEALTTAENAGRSIFFIGGAEIYRQALAVADRMILSRVHGHFTGDRFFPAFSLAQWQLVQEESGKDFDLLTYVRRP
ncbi:dihydrofolate reductase [Geoalkalibacter sp.]|uniref:dihydrofolate reductase n=1 Tax=Geoalkalibacter sp. TaxID=3041440 RepID=UPI00272E354D|nr:dihydrofolate reductase [Geoalkalibacter sp.]